MELLTSLETQVLEPETQLLEMELALLKLSEKKQEEPEVVSDELTEISDAILEVVEDVDIESKVANARAAEQEQLIYAAMETQQKGLDYSKLHYGKLAQPLATTWEYSDYEQKDQVFRAEETLTYEEVEEIVHEKAFADLSNSANTFLKAKTDERFQYWRLFHQALIEVKYEVAFS